MERQLVNEIKINTPIQPVKEKGSTRIKSKILSIIGAGAIAVGNLVHPQTTKAQDLIEYPFNNRSREVLVVCAEENQTVVLSNESLWNITVNGRDFNYGGNLAFVRGSRELNRALLVQVQSEKINLYTAADSRYPNNGYIEVDPKDASFTPGIYRYWHPNIPNLQKYTLSEHRENLIEECFTENRIPQYPLQKAD